MIDDVSTYCLLPGFSLRNRLDFQTSFHKQPRNTRNQVEKSFFTLDDFKKLISLHNSDKIDCSTLTDNNNLSFLNQVHVHRAIFQLFTGTRFESTLDLDVNTVFHAKNCLCSENETCQVITKDCFDILYFKKSKNGSFEVLLLPPAKNCYFFLRNLRHNTSDNHKFIYENFLKFNKKTFSISTHKLRKFVCNLNVDHRNTGNWSSDRVLRSFYLSKFQTFIDLYLLYKRE